MGVRINVGIPDEMPDILRGLSLSMAAESLHY
jgi:hypothetical protein